VGISIAANKWLGIRAAVIHDTFSARVSVQHNNLNVLALGARVIGPELAWDVVEAWLSATFEGGRHQRRLDLISSMENGRSS
jgi:ribose 5-phosphate isomerase B